MCVVGANLGVWAWALLLFRDQPLLLGTTLLAYGFGLRHAVDADHIAAVAARGQIPDRSIFRER
jgi:high-affinity nickel-transport protein